MDDKKSIELLANFVTLNIEALKTTSNDATLAQILEVGRVLSQTLSSGGLIVTAGNGGSMADAMHLAEELSGKYRNHRPALRAVSLSDPTYLTCVGNDFGYENIFSRGCEALLRTGDVAVLYSTSGSSRNILEAAKFCKASGIVSIGITGKANSELGELAKFCLFPPIDLATEQAQLVHTMWTHMLIEIIETNLFHGE